MHADPINITVEAPLSASYRSRAVAGIFDLAIAPTSKASFKTELPRYGEDWQIGLIVRPSGSGKSTIAKHAYRQALFAADSIDWPKDSSVLDGFPEQLSIKDITATRTDADARRDQNTEGTSDAPPTTSGGPAATSRVAIIPPAPGP